MTEDELDDRFGFLVSLVCHLVRFHVRDPGDDDAKVRTIVGNVAEMLHDADDEIRGYLYRGRDLDADLAADNATGPDVMLKPEEMVRMLARRMLAQGLRKLSSPEEASGDAR